jgi:hypothetical protein
MMDRLAEMKNSFGGGMLVEIDVGFISVSCCPPTSSDFIKAERSAMISETRTIEGL